MTKRPSNDTILALIRDGYTNDELCARLGITSRTFFRWRVADTSLDSAIKHERARLTAERQKTTRAHGTANRYRAGCRCPLCTEANRARRYQWQMRRRTALGLPPPDGIHGPRPKRIATVEPIPTTNQHTRIAQAIASGLPPSRIIAQLRVTYEEYRRVREELDEAVSA